jgi:ferredoxin
MCGKRLILEVKMAIRKIIEIDEEKCDGCGECVPSCAEGAIQIIDGKAKVVNETYCDGFGACLGECPQGAITMTEREAPEYDEEAVKRHLAELNIKKSKPLPVIESSPLPVQAHSGCPGSAMKNFNQTPQMQSKTIGNNFQSQLRHWPVQLMLVPPQAPFLKGADILICADCVPFTVPDFHSRYLARRSLLVACPKLDDLQYYYEKLKDIIREAKPQKLTVVKMEVPCCTGIAQVTIQARNEVDPDIPVEVITCGIQGGSQSEKVDIGQVG